MDNFSSSYPCGNVLRFNYYFFINCASYFSYLSRTNSLMKYQKINIFRLNSLKNHYVTFSFFENEIQAIIVFYVISLTLDRFDRSQIMTDNRCLMVHHTIFLWRSKKLNQLILCFSLERFELHSHFWSKIQVQIGFLMSWFLRRFHFFKVFCKSDFFNQSRCQVYF